MSTTCAISWIFSFPNKKDFAAFFIVVHFVVNVFYQLKTHTYLVNSLDILIWQNFLSINSAFHRYFSITWGSEVSIIP